MGMNFNPEIFGKLTGIVRDAAKNAVVALNDSISAAKTEEDKALVSFNNDDKQAANTKSIMQDAYKKDQESSTQAQNFQAVSFESLAKTMDELDGLENQDFMKTFDEQWELIAHTLDIDESNDVSEDELKALANDEGVLTNDSVKSYIDSILESAGIEDLDNATSKELSDALAQMLEDKEITSVQEGKSFALKTVGANGESSNGIQLNDDGTYSAVIQAWDSNNRRNENGDLNNQCVDDIIHNAYPDLDESQVAIARDYMKELNGLDDKYTVYTGATYNVPILTYDESGKVNGYKANLSEEELAEIKGETTAEEASEAKEAEAKTETETKTEDKAKIEQNKQEETKLPNEAETILADIMGKCDELKYVEDVKYHGSVSYKAEKSLEDGTKITSYYTIDERGGKSSKTTTAVNEYAVDELNVKRTITQNGDSTTGLWEYKDASGNLVKDVKQNAKGEKTISEYEYDKNNNANKITTTNPDGTYSVEQKTFDAKGGVVDDVVTKYDAKGNVIGTEDKHPKVELKYERAQLKNMGWTEAQGDSFAEYAKTIKLDIDKASVKDLQKAVNTYQAMINDKKEFNEMCEFLENNGLGSAFSSAVGENNAISIKTLYSYTTTTGAFKTKDERGDSGYDDDFKNYTPQGIETIKNIVQNSGLNAETVEQFNVIVSKYEKHFSTAKVSENPHVALAQQYIEETKDAAQGDTFEAYLKTKSIDIEKSSNSEIKELYNEYNKLVEQKEAFNEIYNYFDKNPLLKNVLSNTFELTDSDFSSNKTGMSLNSLHYYTSSTGAFFAKGENGDSKTYDKDFAERVPSAISQMYEYILDNEGIFDSKVVADIKAIVEKYGVD